MAHAHQHGSAGYDRAFAAGILLNGGFLLLEAAFGLFASSLALLADAGHNFSDVLGLLLAWGAALLTRRRPTERRTYGLRRSSIIAALLNAALLLMAVGGISWEAIRRLRRPEPPPGGAVIWVAAAAVVVNALTALLFLRGRERDVNVRGAFLHMAADAGVSLGVVAAGLAMQVTGWPWLDPAISLAIAAIILISTWGVMRESLDLALDAVPKGIDPSAVEQYLAALPGVAEVHDFHIWALSTTETALTAHLVIPRAGDEDDLLRRAASELQERFGIGHTTLQVERSYRASYPCGTPCRLPDRGGVWSGTTFPGTSPEPGEWRIRPHSRKRHTRSGKGCIQKVQRSIRHRRQARHAVCDTVN
jgi:cobalt-zinc-cadmium efflux system protein